MFTELLERLGVQDSKSGVYCGGWTQQPGGVELESINPATGEPLGRITTASDLSYDRAVEMAQDKFQQWRMLPPPQRGEVVRQLGLALREKKRDLGMLVTLETGKIISEGEGEVQEMIDMCDLATGLSRQLYGLTMASERPQHRLFEQWHPLGPVGIITAFNFPVAVWAWNATIAAVCGNTMTWKPSPHAPLTAIAVQNIVNEVAARNDADGVFNLCIDAGSEIGQRMAADVRVPLVSATGSCAMGRSVAQAVGARLGRSLLELGGNNGVIVSDSADLDLATRAVLFAAIGTAGQRCTSLRRLIVHESIADQLRERLIRAYRSVAIGDPWEEDTLMGPLISRQAVEKMALALQLVRSQGGEVIVGGEPIDRAGFFVEPTMVNASLELPIVSEETFAPILYFLTYRDFDEAIAIHNSVQQGLSSAAFTDRLREAERFLSAAGSDCGIANVNIGTSGAEIGGAFGGEKDTGGGREAGSDAWKAYMRRQTCTVNWGTELPLAQGVKFEIAE